MPPLDDIEYYNSDMDIACWYCLSDMYELCETASFSLNDKYLDRNKYFYRPVYERYFSLSKIISVNIQEY